MYKTLKISIAVFLAAAVSTIALLTYQATQLQSVSAHDSGEAHPHDEQATQAEGETYTYKVQPGDSYTEIARKAVQTYGVDNNVNLTQAGIIFAETNLTNDAGSPELEIGQEVKISKEAVKKYVEEAGKLSDSQQKAWNYYVAFVNFDTNKVGQE